MSELEFNVPFQHKNGYIRDESTEGSSSPKDRLESHQVHLTMLQSYICLQYTVIHITAHNVIYENFTFSLCRPTVANYNKWFK